MFNVNHVNKRFLMLTQVKTIPRLADELEEAAGKGTPLLESYTLAENPHGGGYVEKKFKMMGAVTLEPVRTVAIVGGRFYTSNLVVLKDAGGVLWLDEALEEQVFC